MPSMVSGIRGLNQILSGRIVPDMADVINLLEPSRYPLVTVLNSLKKVKQARNSQIRWMEDELDPRTDLINNAGGYTAAAVSIVVDNGAFFRVNDLIHVPRTSENLRVSGVATNTLTVVRSVGDQSAAAVNDDEPLLILGGAQREGDTSRALISTLEVEHNNFTQIVRTPFGTTNTQAASELYDGNDLDYQAAKKLIEHAIDIERILLFGQRSSATVNNQFLRTCGGLLERIQTNRIDIAGILTESQLDAVCRSAFRYGGNMKLGIFSPRVVQAINNFAKEKLVTVPEDESYGLALRKYVSPFGDLYLTNHWLLQGNIYSGHGIIVDMDNLILRPLRGMDGTSRFAKRVKNIQAPDEDARRDEYLSEFSFMVQQEKTHSLLTNVQG